MRVFTVMLIIVDNKHCLVYFLNILFLFPSCSLNAAHHTCLPDFRDLCDYVTLRTPFLESPLTRSCNEMNKIILARVVNSNNKSVNNLSATIINAKQEH